MPVFSLTRCPYLKIEPKGALCASEGRFIKDMEEVNIKFCLCKNYERCGIYHFSLVDAIRYNKSGALAYS